jgi:formylglycine-generating enzyme
MSGNHSHWPEVVPVSTHFEEPAPALFRNMVWISGGSFLMGSDDHYPEEAPAHHVTVSGFWMDTRPVTNAEFARFVEATGYVTMAERPPDPAMYPGARQEMLIAGSVVFRAPLFPVDMSNHHNWWTWVTGADWRHPEGPESSIAYRADHPVVHVAWDDVAAYALWAGKELPTEAEWEFAARGGLEGAVYCWGDEATPEGRVMANTWQGEFPAINLVLDGFERTSPVGSFAPNGYGLYDMAGNVWEWTADWYQDHRQIKNSCCASLNPKGANEEASYDPRTPDIRIPRKVLKGGSYLCAPNYCFRYRPAARISQQIDTGTCHQGFRCVVRTQA